MNLMDEYAVVGSETVGKVTISTEEYRNLIKTCAEIEIFAGFVKRSKYSIDREDCAMFFGFELPEENNAGD